MKKRYWALIALIAIPTILGRLGVNPADHISTPSIKPWPTPNASATPTPSRTPSNPTPATPRPTPTPADDMAARKRFEAFTHSQASSRNGGGSPTYDGNNVEPSVREFGDTSGMSWVDPYTFQAVGPTPKSWTDVQKAH